jgi:hypothetical protein
LLSNNKGQRLLSFSHRNLAVQFSIHQAREPVVISLSITQISATPFLSLIRKHFPTVPAPREFVFSVLFRTREPHMLFLFRNGHQTHSCSFSLLSVF